MFASLQITHIALVSVCLTFKAYVVVCLAAVAVLQNPYTVLYQVPEQERQKQHLFLLLPMDGFMISVRPRESAFTVLTDENEWPQCYSLEATRRDYCVVDVFHS